MSIPHLKGLTIKELLDFVKAHFKINNYISDYEYDKKPNRNWIYNIFNTMCQAEFQKYLDSKISDCTKHMIRIKSFNLKALQEFINISRLQSIYQLRRNALTFFSKEQENGSKVVMQNN